MTIKELQRRAKAAYKRTPANCILCKVKMVYNPNIGWYVREDGQLGGCKGQFETGSVHHVLDNGRRSHQFAGGSAEYAIKG